MAKYALYIEKIALMGLKIPKSALFELKFPPTHISPPPSLLIFGRIFTYDQCTIEYLFWNESSIIHLNSKIDRSAMIWSFIILPHLHHVFLHFTNPRVNFQQLTPLRHHACVVPHHVGLISAHKITNLQKIAIKNQIWGHW